MDIRPGCLDLHGVDAALKASGLDRSVDGLELVNGQFYGVIGGRSVPIGSYLIVDREAEYAAALKQNRNTPVSELQARHGLS